MLDINPKNKFITNRLRILLLTMLLQTDSEKYKKIKEHLHTRLRGLSLGRTPKIFAMDVRHVWVANFENVCHPPTQKNA